MNILIADDHQLFRNGLAAVLKKFDFVSKVKGVSNGKEAVEEMANNKYEIVLMDITMPVMNGTDATKIIRRNFPETKVIALTMFEDQKHVVEMIEMGASGYIIKNTDNVELKNALLKVSNSELYFSKQISEGLINTLLYKHTLKKSQYNEQISVREKEVLCLICKEYTTKEIAAALFISEKTVDWHRLNLLQKTNSKNTAGLVIFAMKCGLIDGVVHN